MSISEKMNINTIRDTSSFHVLERLVFRWKIPSRYLYISRIGGKASCLYTIYYGVPLPTSPSIGHLFPTVNKGRRALETCPPIAIGLDPDTPVCFVKALYSWLKIYWYYDELKVRPSVHEMRASQVSRHIRAVVAAPTLCLCHGNDWRYFGSLTGSHSPCSALRRDPAVTIPILQ